MEDSVCFETNQHQLRSFCLQDESESNQAETTGKRKRLFHKECKLEDKFSLSITIENVYQCYLFVVDV